MRCLPAARLGLGFPVLLLLGLGAPPGAAQGWSNYGANPGRNGWVDTCGPDTGEIGWRDGSLPSVITWHPFVDGDGAYVVRQSGFPRPGGPAGDVIVAYDLRTGSERWRTTLPYGGDPSREWTAWLGGVDGGRLLVSRSTQGMPQPLRALSAVDGSTLWVSDFTTEASAHDGVVLAPNGDWIVGEGTAVSRVGAADGALVWRVPRTCSVSGACGVAATDRALFLDEPAPGGNRLVKLDLGTGARLYAGPVMAGSVSQNTPFLSHAGDVVYFAQSENDPATDRLYAFHDDGSALRLLWKRPIRWTVHHGHAIAGDGSLYTFLPDGEFARLDPATGAVRDTAGVLGPLGANGFSPKTAVDHAGRVYVSNGWIGSPPSNGRLWAFSADLSRTHFILALDRPNAGGPALGGDGWLLIADTAEVRAYRTQVAPQEISRRGTPPNPDVFRPARSRPPVLGALWDPWIDHTTFAPGALLDFVALTAAAAATNVPLPGGTLLCTPRPDQVVVGAPGSPFSIPLPADCSFRGYRLCAQGGAITPAGTRFANALDVVIGNP